MHTHFVSNCFVCNRFENKRFIIYVQKDSEISKFITFSGIFALRKSPIQLLHLIKSLTGHKRDSVKETKIEPL